MHHMNDLRKLDLNLLVVLETMLAELHVTRAATRLGMSQPAVSHALGRLRALFDDALFVRGADGLRPTARAARLAAPVSQALMLVRGMVKEPVFDPSQARLTLRIAMSDYGAALILPTLMRRLRVVAPGVDLIVTQGSREQMALQVQEGELDLAIGVFPNLPGDVRSALLFEEEFVCVLARKNRWLVRGSLKLDGYLAAPHLLVSVRGEPVGEVETALAALGLRRHIAMILPHFLLAPQIIVDTDLILTIAKRTMTHVTGNSALVVAKPPLTIPSFQFTQIWHARNDLSPSHLWFRRELAAALVDANTRADG